MTVRHTIWAFVICLILIEGCASRISPTKKVICPAPEQECKTERWSGIAVDTSESFRKVADFYYVFEPVAQINTPENEWSLSFLDKKKAVLMYDDNNQQRLLVVRMISDNRAVTESGFGVPLDGSVGPISVRKKNQVVFSATYPPNEETELIGNSDLYSAELQENMILHVRKITDGKYFSKNNWEAQPTLSPDGNVIFFSSDLYPLKGTEILFIVKMPDGTWSKPIDCGDSINSACDEVTPFITKDGNTLLFSSCGHETVGGFDIFSSSISPEFWELAKNADLKALQNPSRFFGAPKNLRPPLNTAGDELFPSSPGKIENLLYYSSNQDANSGSMIRRRGGFDIFVRRKVLPEIASTTTSKKEKLNLDFNFADSQENPSVKMPDKIISPVYKLKGSVYNAVTKEKIANADVTVDEISPDREMELTSQGSDILRETFKLKSDSKGDYEVTLKKGSDYVTTIEAKDLFFDTYKTRIENDDTTETVYRDFYIPEQLTLRINFPTNVYNNPYRYTLDSNGMETNTTWFEEINTLANNILKNKDHIEKLLLIGNTDDVGSDATNDILGMNRVNFVISELVKRSVPNEMLTGRSAGKREPLFRRDNEDLAIYRKRLRRVDLQKVIKTN